MEEEGSQCGGAISDSPLRILEFYSGIGAMRYALQKTGVNARVIEAFEINDVANDVYEHNFGHRPYQGNIQSLTVADLDNYKAHAWFLSPPCQPYTRQGLQKDSSDARAFSFLNILELIPQLSQAPLMLFVENVVGFEVSDTHGRMIDVLKRSGFVTQEFMLTPLQFGVPYSRPRYFCLAKRMPLSFQNPRCNFQLLHNSNPLFGHHIVTDDNASFPLEENWEEKLKSCKQIDTFLEYWCANNKDEMTPQISPSTNGLPLSSEPLERCNQSVGSDGFSVDRYLVPFSLIERWGSAMDIVYPDSQRCCCFTKSYYRYVKGTGSLLATIQPEVKGKASSPLKEQRLRYFTPREVANLHSFPKEFGFPEHVSLRQRYALLGNSMSIAVVAPLIKYLFTEPT